MLFLGSTIGNFEAIAALSFLRKIRSMLEPGDFLLLGTDLLKTGPGAARCLRRHARRNRRVQT